MICLNCAYTITEEVREKLLKEQEKQSSHDSLEDSSAQKWVLKQQKEHKFQKKLNKISLGFFKVGFTEMIVPLLIIILIIIIIILMFF